MKIPGPDHPIIVTPYDGHVVVSAGGQVIVDTTNALSLREADYPPVFYLPREDADLSKLTRTDLHTTCPYKGEASYFSINGTERGENAIWTYETPYEAVADIADHLAFYPDRVQIQVD